MRATAERLAAALADLPVVIDAATVRDTSATVPSYGGHRPSSTVTLSGAGREGAGEHVGFDAEAHAAFRRTLREADLAGGWRVGRLAHALRERELPPYDRAAIEMAAIALGLRQRTSTLASLAGVTPRPIRHVVSFGRTPDPAAEAGRHPASDLKVDADPAWSDEVWRRLGATRRVAVLDWKDGGDAAAYARALRWVPDALHEDPAPPYPDGVAAWLALDVPLTEPAALDGTTPAACNLKPSRMGSLLDAVRLAGHCGRRGIAVYVGGMFEIGVGRDQLRDLAAVLCPDAPNDLAPIPLAGGDATP